MKIVGILNMNIVGIIGYVIFSEEILFDYNFYFEHLLIGKNYYSMFEGESGKMPLINKI